MSVFVYEENEKEWQEGVLFLSRSSANACKHGIMSKGSFFLQTRSCHFDPFICGGWHCIRTYVQLQDFDEENDLTFLEGETGEAL